MGTPTGNFNDSSQELPSSVETVNSKIISAAAMLGSTFLLTILPAIVLRKAARVRVYGPMNDSRSRTNWRHHLLSAFNCFAAGVFVSAGLLHIFIDANEDIVRGLEKGGYKTEFPITMFILLCGVFLLLIIEQTVDFVVERRKQIIPARGRRKKDPENGQGQMEIQDTSVEDAAESIQASAGDPHEEVIDPHSPIQSIVLVTALSVHSVFEGLALGLQHTMAEVYKVLLIISLHKLAIAVSMGVNLAQAQAKTWFMVIIAFIFAVSSPIGALIGLGVVGAYDPSEGLVVGILQALACGTFVYVTFFEILPRELSKKDCMRSLCMFGLILGFLGVSLYTWLMGHGHEHHHDELEGHHHRHHHKRL